MTFDPMPIRLMLRTPFRHVPQTLNTTTSSSDFSRHVEQPDPPCVAATRSPFSPGLNR